MRAESVAVSCRAFEFRWLAARVLGRLNDPRAVEPLIGALKDRRIGTGAAEALGQLADPGAVEPLVAALEYAPRSEPLFTERNLRVAAAAALAKLAGPQAIQPLRSLPRRECSSAAVAALVRRELHSRLADAL